MRYSCERLSIGETSSKQETLMLMIILVGLFNLYLKSTQDMGEAKIDKFFEDCAIFKSYNIFLTALYLQTFNINYLN